MKKLENISLKDYTTFKTGGSAKYLIEVKSKKEIVKAVDFAKKEKLPIFVLGGGSDILVSDEDFKGVVIRYTGEKLKVISNKSKATVTAEAGMGWDKLVHETVKRNLQGIESLSGIPGTVGASPIQNIGAYGQELKDSFVSLTAYDVEGEKFVEFDKEKCEFSYRESFFKKRANWQKFVITEITLELAKDGKPEVKYASLINYLNEKGIKVPNLEQIRDAVLTLRGAKLEDPKVIGNAGSFFKNPIIEKGKLEKLVEEYPSLPFYEMPNGFIKLFSGWLIEKAGWKGKSYGAARVSEKNALVITNPEGKATAKEIKALSEAISKDVFNKFGVTLEPEVQYINFK